MKLADDPEIDQVARHHEANDAGKSLNFFRCGHEIVIDDPVQEELNKAKTYPPDAFLIDRLCFAVVIRPTVRPVVDYRKQQEADIRQEKEVRQPGPY